MSRINIIGGGLAGSECALYLANHGHKVDLYDIKGEKFTPAHHSPNYAEIVCSNSFKSDDENSASGIFKRELILLGSELLKVAYNSRVPAGQALAIDREIFSSEVTNKLKSNPNITIHTEDVSSFEDGAITVVATGPLTTPNMCEAIKTKIGADLLYFYDAAAPIVDAETIDMSKVFLASRYDKGEAAYLNCPMNREEYTRFYTELVNAKTIELHSFEKKNIFEGCMPIEIMASRGADAIRFGPLKPVGFVDPHTNTRPYAVVQLRKENEQATMYNLVGFQTNLTFGEQKRVFRLIPGLERAEFLRYGVMHTNNFLNFPNTLDVYSRLKVDNNIFIAGQLSGVEGYVESIASGLYCAINIDRLVRCKELITFSADTILGGIYNYLVNAEPKHVQPMNANLGLLNPIDERDKNKRNERYRLRSLSEIKRIKEEIDGTI